MTGQSDDFRSATNETLNTFCKHKFPDGDWCGRRNPCPVHSPKVTPRCPVCNTGGGRVFGSWANCPHGWAGWRAEVSEKIAKGRARYEEQHGSINGHAIGCISADVFGPHSEYMSCCTGAVVSDAKDPDG